MSRAATATPPPAYFPSRNATPTMRHCSAPNVSAAHFATRPQHGHSNKRRTKNLPSSSTPGFSSGPAKKVASNGLNMSFEEIPLPLSPPPKVAERPRLVTDIPCSASIASAPTSASTDSWLTSRSQSSSPSPIDAPVEQEEMDEEVDRSTPTPSMLASGATSFVATPLPTPSSSRTPSLLHQEGLNAEASASSLGLLIDVQQFPAASSGLPVVPPPPSIRASWVPYFGKMAKAVVNTGMSMGKSFGDKKRKDNAVVTPKTDPVPLVPAIYSPCQPLPRPPIEELQQLSGEAATARRREWATAEQRRITECARLCSQWPRSGYNLSKWGPNGARHFYEPQSYSNPEYVESLMERQAELEHQMCTASTTFYSCRRAHVAPSDDDSEPSFDSYDSSQASPTASMSLSSDYTSARTAADIKAAMTSPLLPLSGFANGSQVSLLLPNSPKPIRAARSLTELDVLASSMKLGREDNAMDVDPIEQRSGDGASSGDRSEARTHLIRAQSCGSKRHMSGSLDEEDKRRKVDEAMVVEEAVDTGVIVPSKPCGQNPTFSGATPDRSRDQVQNQASVFGHVVKTSDTHPIIISPFFPAELLPVLSEHLVMPLVTGPASSTPLLMASDIDVPSLLLSFAPPTPNALVPSPVQSAYRQQQIANLRGQTQSVGNMLLSSCPGKRLRMGGPVKGRGPVCRDIATDLRRIKNEGVGCLVCCLDDPELALLGVPWETYREVAAETGLDVIRLPMPDGFSPVSFRLFDAQVSLIATKYSLHGINVLVHCRGGVGRAGLTACAWAIKMGFVPPHPSLSIVEQAAIRQGGGTPSPELEHQIVMSIAERVIAMIRSRRGLKAIESFEQVQFLASYVRWLRASVRGV